MPQAVLHILAPLITLALFKDWYDKNHNKKFSLHYVLIGGIAGILPDLDIALFWILHFFNFGFETIHRTIAHTLFVPLIFFILFLAFMKADVKARICNIGRHNLKLSTIFLMLAIGSLFHIVLDGIFGEPVAFLYPLSQIAIGINIASLFPAPLDSLFIPTLEGGLFIIWLIYLEAKHKISDYI